MRTAECPDGGPRLSQPLSQMPVIRIILEEFTPGPGAVHHMISTPPGEKRSWRPWRAAYHEPERKERLMTLFDHESAGEQEMSGGESNRKLRLSSPR